MAMSESPPNTSAGQKVLDDPDLYLKVDLLYQITTSLTLYVQPIICVFGFFGNTIALIAFSSAKMRTISSNIYLAGLSISNSAFLLALFIVWLEITDIRLIHQNGWCQAVIYTSYVCSFLSVWLIVCIAIENYLITFHLTQAAKLCTVFRAFIVVFGLTFASLLLYDFAIWTTKAVSFGNTTYCIVPKEYGTIVSAFTIVDVVVTFVLPSILLVILIMVVFVKNMSNLRHLQTNIHHTALSRKERSLLRVTRLLFVISLSFLLLTLPSHMNKLRHLVTSLTYSDKAVSIKDSAIQHLFQLFYYASFSCNFIYYLIWSKNFRKYLKNVYTSIRCKVTCC